MAMDYAARRAKLKRLPDSDTIAIVPGASLHYFTGLNYHLSERPIIALFRDQELSMIVPQLEVPQLQQRTDLEVRTFVWNDTDGYQGAFNQAVESLQIKTLGVDEKTMRLFEWLAFLESDLNMKLEEHGHALLMIRAQKEAAEVAAMREAIRISQAALDEVLKQIEPGMTEREIGALLDQTVMTRGSQGLAFRALVQIGENSALPHGSVSDRVLKEGEFILIDFGGMYEHYLADITRTFCLGTPSAEMQKIYDTVVAANQAAIAAIKPGVECGEVDRAARSVIEAAGYGEYFIHRTGHGLGLEVHELPQIAPGVEDKLLPGMVFTIEPGIYIQGLGGVRIEDNVLVTETGVEVLTHYPYQLSL